MSPVDIIALLVILLCIGAAGFYIYKSKKRGAKCIGCPHCDSCSKKRTGGI